MTAASATRTKVVVQQAIDEAVYFVDGEITYKSVAVEDGEGVTTRVVYVCFTPSNGYDKGKEHSVPVSRVIAIVTDD